MALDKAMICAGLGCRSGISQEAVLAALDAALAHHALALGQLDILATIARKMQEPAFREAAAALGLPLKIAADNALHIAGPQCLTISRASLITTGVNSAAEAAALAVCGSGARLLGPRLALSGVTCAIAVNRDKA